jgi:hypothetical protein
MSPRLKAARWRGKIRRGIESSISLAVVDHILQAAANCEVIVAVAIEIRHFNLLSGLRDTVIVRRAAGSLSIIEQHAQRPGGIGIGQAKSR